MFTALQDSFRWTNDMASEVVTGFGSAPHPVRHANSYIWRPAVKARDGAALCTLSTFSYS